jgi:hypothetical protein
MGGSTGSVTAVRSYSFEGGESVNTPSAALEQDFVLSDRAVSAYSSACSGPSRVRLTATFQANVADKSSDLQLDSVDFTTSFRSGVEFKEGCSSDQLMSAEPAATGEWCAGDHSRACASGLQCEFDELNFIAGANSNPEGSCVDPAEKGGVAEVGDPCGGLKNIQCPADSVCWHKPDAPQNWLGRCVRQAAEVGNPCHIGQPSLECAAPFLCLEESNSCVQANGSAGDPCGLPNFPDCQKPLFCNNGNICAEARGAAGEPCGEPDLPECRSPMQCENNRCVDHRAGVGKPCGEGTLGCQSRLVCINDICSTPKAKSCIP